eukprot:scpid75868/ scgid23967/ Carnitinyl-CoA dehydratase; Crotonobetainyl-CoA hydratase &gt; Carnitinyl-CoA dehydratase; Crotonobetainyl-CoA hydratase
MSQLYFGGARRANFFSQVFNSSKYSRQSRSLCHEAPGMSAVETRTHGDSVFVISLNRPEKRNAVDAATASLLAKTFRQFEQDESLRVAVLTGNGGNFCAGYDLKFLAESGSSAGEDLIRTLTVGEQDTGLGPMGPSRYHLSKPLIAAVSGYAVAGGLELSLVADMRVADETATFGVFCRRFGVPLIDGGTVRLPKLIGLSRALDMILTGRPVRAQEALAFGLANRVVPPGDALSTALEIAASIASFPPHAMNADRTSAIRAAYSGLPLADALRQEALDGADALIDGQAWNNASGFVQGTGRHGKFGSPSSKL